VGSFKNLFAGSGVAFSLSGDPGTHSSTPALCIAESTRSHAQVLQTKEHKLTPTRWMCASKRRGAARVIQRQRRALLRALQAV